MSEVMVQTTDLRRFETVNLNLAAVLLSRIPDSQLASISPAPSIDGKRLLTIRYPADQEQAVQRLVERFVQRNLVVNLYDFNRTLNGIRDALHRTREAEAR
jgi:hypothetical protein